MAWVNIDDVLGLMTPDNISNLESAIEERGGAFEEYKKLKIWASIDFNSAKGTLNNTSGGYTFVVLKMLGIKEYPVDLYDVSKTSTSKSAPIKSLKLTGLKDGKTYIFNDVIPLSGRYRIFAEEEFGLGSKRAFGSRGIGQSVKEANRNMTKKEDAVEKQVESSTRENLDRMIDEYGAIEPGENPARDVQIPQSTDGEDRVSQTLRTVMEANVTPDSYIPTIEEMIESGEYSFKSFGDQEALSMAYNKIQKKGFPNALADWTKEVGKGRVSKELTAMGWVLYNNAVNSGDTATATRILSLMASHQREAARALQASRILKKLDPESQLHNIEADVEDIIDAVGKRAPDIEIPPELIDKFRKAKTDEERAEVEAEIIQDVARKIPSTLKDKWNAWRYLAMLFNLRTHIRNVVGNAGFAGVVVAKDIIATGAEAAVYYTVGKNRGMQKTKSIYGKELFAAAWNDYKKMESEVLGDAKYNDSQEYNAKIEDARVIFPGLFGKPIEFLRKLNSKALEIEDSWFARPHYANALAQYCAANGISPDAIKSGVGITKEELDKARAYAIKEAQKATYRDLNQFSEWIQGLGRVRPDDSSVKKGVKILIDGILPFRKTPANILVRGLEYSPLGFAYGLSRLIFKAKKVRLQLLSAWIQ